MKTQTIKTSPQVYERAAGMAPAFFGFSTFLYPPPGYELSPYLLLVGVVGGVSQILWLLVKGVNVKQWKHRALETA